LTGEELSQALGRLSLFVAPGGIFVFDVNTAYKHRRILASNCFVYERSGIYCVWQNALQNDDSVEITLDFFEHCGNNSYKRHREQFYEYIHEDGALRAMLDDAGFDVLDIFEADTDMPPTAESDRLIYVAKRRYPA
jgi:hypothetical protein